MEHEGRVRDLGSVPIVSLGARIARGDDLALGRVFAEVLVGSVFHRYSHHYEAEIQLTTRNRDGRAAERPISEEPYRFINVAHVSKTRRKMLDTPNVQASEEKAGKQAGVFAVGANPSPLRENKPEVFAQLLGSAGYGGG
jgi:hypothetical protein